LAVGFQGALLAQTRTVTGTVTGGDDGLGIPRANILVKGTTRGTNTNLDGQFSIEVTADETLVFSFVGYVTQEVAVGNQTTINIVLQPDYAELGEVVVVGYGSQEKKEITSSVVAVDAKDFNQGNVNDAAGLLQGKVPGLQVFNKGGNPNNSGSFRLRGISSVGSNAQPLVVIDGVIGASLDNVDPNDIESINVLKDGSAAAIYGSRGSAGVILVTTKQGTRGGSSLQADYNGFVSAATVRQFQPVMDAATYVANGGNDLGSVTDWQDEITRTAISNVHNISVSGSSENTTFRVSTNFRNIQGILDKSGFDQINARANLNHFAVNDKLNISFNMALSQRNQNFSFNEAFRYASLFNPTAPIRNPNGSFFQAILFDNFNPVAILNQNINQGERQTLNFNTQLSYEFFPGFRVTANYAQQFGSQIQGRYFSRESLYVGLGRNGLAARQADENRFTLFETFASWDKELNNANLTLTAGYSWQESQNTGFGMEAGNFPTDDLGFNIIGASGNVLGRQGEVNIYSYETPEDRIIAGFLRFNLTIGNGIFVNGGVRREGSTRLGVDNQWGTFPFVGAGVDILEYADIAAFDVLKFRAGYGVTGSLPGASGQAQDLFAYNRDDSAAGGNVSRVRGGNPDLKWEEKAEINLGLDFGLLGSKLTGTLDVYSRDVNDFILNRQVDPAIFGFSNRFENAGKIQDRGIELALTYNNLLSGDLKWTPGIIASSNKTTLEEYIIDETSFANLGSPGQNGTNMIRVAVGEEIGQIWGPQFVGVSDTGEPIFADLNGDGTVNADPASILNDDSDSQQLGTGIPTVNIGWTNQLSYGNWDLNLFFRASLGHSLVNTFRAFYEPLDPGAINSFNRTVTDLSLTDLTVAQFSSYYVEKADFIRLDNATIGYNFDMSGNDFIRNIRVYGTVQDAFVLTNYQGVDPDPVGDDGGNVLAPGIDRRNNYFDDRTYTFGLTIGF